MFPGSPVHPRSEGFETELGVGVDVSLHDAAPRSVMRPGTSPAGTRLSASTTRLFPRPARVHRPPAHLRDFERRRVMNVYSVPQDIKHMDGLDVPLPVRAKDPAGYECDECSREPLLWSDNYLSSTGFFVCSLMNNVRDVSASKLGRRENFDPKTLMINVCTSSVGWNFARTEKATAIIPR